MATLRKSKAEKSLNIDVWSGLDLLSENDYLRSQAFDEKLRERKRKPLNLSERMDALLAKHKDDKNDKSGDPAGMPQLRTPSLPRRQTRSATVESDTHRSIRSESVLSTISSNSSIATSSSPVRPPSSSTSYSTQSEVSSSKTPLVSRNRSSTSGTSSSRRQSTNTPTPLADVYNSRANSSKVTARQAGSTPHSSAKNPTSGSRPFKTPLTPSTHPASASHKGKERARPDILPTPRTIRLAFEHSQVSSKRENMSRRWSKCAAIENAESITFVNTVDNEELPFLPDNFRYLESGYNYSHKNISEKIDLLDQAVFTRCECRKCTSATRCDCQDSSEIFDEEYKRRKLFAYSDEGLFLFNVPGGTEVIECNEYCKCLDDELSCPNRVAQRPRRFPVEIFKTRNCGWGVRSTINIEAGRVLGHYSGPRAEAETLKGPNKMFCFDIDGREDPNEDESDEAYSVDARYCGNWTRFLNHSCSPNVMVYQAVWATIPEMKMPNLVFVASRDIPAGTEFTFDYDPSAAQLSSKGKGRIPKGASECMCGSEECRGFVRV
ncbi:hypothetical protein VKT23_001822 [Stygiomarasmius scandens]|uniref:SET domain-containing protein n=1 Tax=Marasmiellus scandens TaxID=2682957 RepID=A0ABR1K2N3_9AGAR